MPKNIAMQSRISKHRQCYQGGMIIIALGSNLPGLFGTPKNTLQRALSEIARSGIEIKDTSKLYRTKAYSQIPQPDFLNAIAVVYTPLSAGALLKILKRIEAQAGRREIKAGRSPNSRWIARPLDLDIVSYKGIIYNWKMRKPLEEERVVLPHPRAHERAFVLRPLSEVAPSWHHPVFGLTASELLKRPRVRQTGAVLDAGEPFR
jgi:2-amino-4-hydroxy-6-hydroxymethyldihydropteridine diphosphokinase